mmetsp:Transcript_33895/g.97529  ORF Transcript_33895/g.97529 Transcript_33895/m.97529 type:complete len:262 (-) Transcript_33895:145-930(-)
MFATCCARDSKAQEEKAQWSNEEGWDEQAYDDAWYQDAENGGEYYGEWEEHGEEGGFEDDAPEAIEAGGECNTMTEGQVISKGSFYRVELVKKGSEGMCGWRLDYLDHRTIYISDLLADPGSPVQVYNETAFEGKDIRQGDYICSVNGKVDIPAMRRMLQSQMVLDLKISRPRLTTFTIHKGSKGMGLDLKWSQGGMALLVDSIKEGTVQEGKLDIKPGDRILAVGGKTGCWQTLLDVMKASDPVTLLISRCPPKFLWGAT